MGNIHSSIKKLLADKCIIFDELVDNGKYKKVYSITPKGKEFFNSWVNSSFEATHKRIPELKKIFFMSFSDKNTRDSRIKEYIESIKNDKVIIGKYIEHSSEILSTLDDRQYEIASFQIEAIQYELDMIDFEIEWYEKLLKRMQTRLDNKQNNK
ncbi:MAG: PadR family transcriptional regulator [Coprobacillaceae bacterium]